MRILSTVKDKTFCAPLDCSTKWRPNNLFTQWAVVTRDTNQQLLLLTLHQTHTSLLELQSSLLSSTPVTIHSCYPEGPLVLHHSLLYTGNPPLPICFLSPHSVACHILLLFLQLWQVQVRLLTTLAELFKSHSVNMNHQENLHVLSGWHLESMPPVARPQ